MCNVDMYVAELLTGFYCFQSGLRRCYVEVDGLFDVNGWYCERFQSKDVKCCISIAELLMQGGAFTTRVVFEFWLVPR